MSDWFRDYPPAIRGLRDWFRMMPEQDLDDVIAELRTGVATLGLAEAIRNERQLHAAIRDAAAEAVPEADPDRFAEAVVAISRARRQLGKDGEDPVSVLDAALEVARYPPHPNEEKPHEGK